MKDFQNKTVWIIGASSGLGEALAHAFSDAGAKLILSARRKDALYSIEEKVKSAFVLPLDMEKKETFASKTQEAIAAFGGIDLVILNAGIAQRSSALETLPEVERKIMEVDYFSYTEITRCLLPHFLEKKQGHLVVVSGLLAQIYLPGRSSYAAAKSALLGYFGCLRAEVSRNNIDITLLIPGSLKTDLASKALDKEGQKIKEKVPQTGCDTTVAAKQILNAIYKKKHQVYIGKKDKAFVLWKLSKVYPNFVTRLFLKMTA